MGWDLLIPLIIGQGLNVAEAIWTKWNSKQEVTAQDWADLKALAAQDASARMREALIRNGLDLNDPKAIALLALIAPK